MYIAKLEIHTRIKWSVANWHYDKVDSTQLTAAYVDTEKKTAIIHSLRCFLIDV